jgi:hypothetical protein
MIFNILRGDKNTFAGLKQYLKNTVFLRPADPRGIRPAKSNRKEPDRVKHRFSASYFSPKNGGMALYQELKLLFYNHLQYFSFRWNKDCVEE